MGEFQMPEIDVTQISKAKARVFILDVLLDDQWRRFPSQSLNLDSLIAEIAIATAVNLPRIAGWNVYNEKGDLVMSIPAVEFLTHLAEVTPLKQSPSGKKPGWSAIPIITPTSDAFNRMIEESKKEGRVPE